MPKYIDEIEEKSSITDSINSQRNRVIGNILNLVDVLEISVQQKKKIREVVLDEVNGYHNYIIKVLTYIQEHENKV